jgi:hypothetical protein
MYRIVQGRVMRIDLRTNFPSVASRVAAIGQQGPFALAVSMTRSAKDAQAAMRAEEQRVFDKPTAYALNGNYIKPATKQHLVAELGVKSKSDSKGAPLERVLGPEIYGGGRFQKGFERMLTRAGVLPAGWMAIPAAAARLDGNGNVRRAQLEQVLAGLDVSRSEGKGRLPGKRGASRKGVTYFALAKKSRGLKPGIYWQRETARSSTIRPVFIFVRSVTYRVRLKYDEVGQKAFNNAFPAHFDREAARAIASAT